MAIDPDQWKIRRRIDGPGAHQTRAIALVVARRWLVQLEHRSVAGELFAVTDLVRSGECLC